MLAKRFLQKKLQFKRAGKEKNENSSSCMDPHIVLHYGLPSTASILAFDSIQRLLAIGTLDGRIKVMGTFGIETLLVTSKKLPCKNLEFLQNQGYLVSISSDDDIQVWNLKNRKIACCLQWESKITAFSIVSGSHFMYVGDEHGSMSVIKFDAEEESILKLPYLVSASSMSKATGFQISHHESLVGVLSQPGSDGNRILIAYQHGLIALWDVQRGNILFIGGGTDTLPKDKDVDTSEPIVVEKEITALCWASSNGSIVAVGYLGGDILLWNISCDASTDHTHAISTSNNIIKLQLSFAERRLPVIVLHWSINDKSNNGCDGLLFVYGGDEIGSEEVLTIISLEWSSRMDCLNNATRRRLSLMSSFAGMVLLSNVKTMPSYCNSGSIILTSPGKLHFLSDEILCDLVSQQDSKLPFPPVELPNVVPINNPSMTVAKLCRWDIEINSSNTLSELASVMKFDPTTLLANGTKWPLTGGVDVEPSIIKEKGIQRVYLAGYSDGSTRLWDATYPMLYFICVFEGKEQGINMDVATSPVSDLEFCCSTFSLAVGNKCGLVFLYDLIGCLDQTHLNYITSAQREVLDLPPDKMAHSKAVFSIAKSQVQTMKFSSCGDQLAVGFECGSMGVISASSLSVLIWIDSMFPSSSPIVALIWGHYLCANKLGKSKRGPHTNAVENTIFVLSKDVDFDAIDVCTGDVLSLQPWHKKEDEVAIFMGIIENGAPNEMVPLSMIDAKKSSFFLLLCCEYSLRLYTLPSTTQRNKKPICKLKLAKRCCWASILKDGEEVRGFILLFETGEIETRSFPNLELVKAISLESMLRWHYKSNMEKMMSSDGNGYITLVNDCEMAFISILAGEDHSRTLESIPCLHDESLAIAMPYDAAVSSVSSHQKKNQGSHSGIMGEKPAPAEESRPTLQSNLALLEGQFLKNSPFSEPHLTIKDDNEIILDIDDLEIDEPLIVSPPSAYNFENTKAKEGPKQKRLLHGGTNDIKPKVRTLEEIKATYRDTMGASAAAAHARDKLVERQEKLERISQRTEELHSGAQNFASMADELVKTMEARKWWHI